MILIALSPILWLIIALSVLKIAAYKACPIALVIALAAGIFVNDMTIPHAVEATLDGVALACWNILVVIIAGVFSESLRRDGHRHVHGPGTRRRRRFHHRNGRRHRLRQALPGQ